MLEKEFFDKLKESFSHSLPLIASFFAPGIWVFLIVLLFVLVDTNQGLKTAKFKKKKFSTNRFSDMFAKLIGYITFLLFGLLIDKATGWSYAVWLSSVVPILTELKSIDESQRERGEKGIIKQFEEAYQFAKKIKNKRDELR